MVSNRGETRVIAGRWRGRKLRFSDHPGLRPTTDRVRETVFNWLQADIAGARCLDLFAGSGGLGFEAASRGASQVVMVESNREVCEDISMNIAALEASSVEFIRMDAFGYLSSYSGPPFDLVFLDPPFRTELLPRVLQTLMETQCLSNHAKIYVESGSDENVATPANWVRLRSKQAGQVEYSLYQITEDQE